ncbi:MAG: hypothetical protein AB7D39_06370 [Pseudodesulfovibrio sp.]|uniref:hypothetical protein n=1 Tax=Pseudodesulfovibrio sp. TaxID=2035812 RepID=UPI003D0D2C70
MKVKSEREKAGFTPITFSITVESYGELNQLWSALYDSNDPFIEDLFNEVVARCKEEDGE